MKKNKSNNPKIKSTIHQENNLNPIYQTLAGATKQSLRAISTARL